MVLVNSSPVTLRVKFFKKGRLQYISHLDLVRTMMKIIVRAKLPLWYTEGFNPKPKIVFAAPLSIGTESECEFMDIRLTERLSETEAMLSLNSNMTEEMQITEAYYPDTKLTDLRWLGYRISLHTNFAQNLSKSIKELLSESELRVMKKGKSGIREVNIKPLIKEFSVSDILGDTIIDCILLSDSADFLNPELIVKLIKERLNVLADENLDSEWYSIVRNSAYRADMSPFR